MNFQSSENNENQIEDYGKIRQIYQWLLRGLAVNAPGGASFRPFMHRLRGVEIGKRVWISLHVYIDSQYPQAISIGDDCIIGLRTSLIAHLGDYVRRQTGADMLMWDGACIVHEEFKARGLLDLKNVYPDAAVLVHPESPASVIELADRVGSTTQIIQAASELPNQQFIVATDQGIFYKMQQSVPGNLKIGRRSYWLWRGNGCRVFLFGRLTC